MDILELIGFDKNDQNLKSYIINLNEDLSQETDDVKVYAYEARKLSNKINYILLQNNVNSLKPIAYIIDNTYDKLIDTYFEDIKYYLWLNVSVPILYIINDTKIDIIFTNKKPIYKGDHFEFINDIIDLKTSINNNKKFEKYSIYRLIDGTFWEDSSNEDKIIEEELSHKILIDKIKDADKYIMNKFKSNKPKHIIGRKLLIVTLLIKYLEDREVLKKDFFYRIGEKYSSYIDILKDQNIESLKKLLLILENKFNGDIFVLDNIEELDLEIINTLYKVIEAKNYKNQWYLWKLYNFKHIPVEVLSSIYQYFANDKLGAIFTPIHLVNLILDEVMPLNEIKGNEKIFDPTCGSGIFLVSAFKRLVLKNIINKNISSPYDSNMLSPEQLKNILVNSIFGIEIQKEAAQLTCFSLALGICDALTPNVIWEKLKFDKLINSNIFNNNFFDINDEIKNKVKNGFDIIIGNPPFEVDTDNRQKIKKGVICYDIQIKCINEYLSDNGKSLLIQPYGILYNKKLSKRKKEIFNNFYVSKIYDFTSINFLFNNYNKKVNTKCVALLVEKNKKVEDNHQIKHLIFRNTIISKNKIFFEMNHYDNNIIYNNDILQYNFCCLSNILGGGRIIYLMKKLSGFHKLKDFLKLKNLESYEGYIIGGEKSESQKKKAEWLANYKYISEEQLKNVEFEINSDIFENLNFVKENKFIRSRDEKIYKSPLFMIYEGIDLDCAISKKYDIAYKDRIIGIISNNKNDINLIDLANNFYKNKKIMSNSIKILSNYSISQRYVLSKNDVISVPFEKDIEKSLLEWEKDIINDIDYIIDFIKKGNESYIMKKVTSKEDINKYNDTFVRLMLTSFNNFNFLYMFEKNGIIFSVYSFTKNTSFNIINDEKLMNNLVREIYYKYGTFLYINRIIRIFSNDILIIVKPNKLRYWIKSIAIRDVDDVINDIITRR